MIDSISDVFGQLVRDVHACATLESLATGKGFPKAAKPRVRRRGGGAAVAAVSAAAAATARGVAPKAVPFDTHERVTEVVQACREARKRHLADAVEEDLSDERLSKLARFTDDAALAPFASFLHFVPRLVNIVRCYTASPFSITPDARTPCTGDSGRGRPHARLGTRARPAARPRQDCRQVQRRLLCSQAVCGGAPQSLSNPLLLLLVCRTPSLFSPCVAGPARLHQPALPHPRLS